jgi:cytochrome b
MLGLIALHILGVVISSRKHKENLVKAMITGEKNLD